MRTLLIVAWARLARNKLRCSVCLDMVHSSDSAGGDLNQSGVVFYAFYVVCWDLWLFNWKKIV